MPQDPFIFFFLLEKNAVPMSLSHRYICIIFYLNKHIYIYIYICMLRHSVVSDSLQPTGLYSLPGSSVHGIFQARILEWVAISSSEVSSWLRNQTRVSCVSCLGRWVLHLLSHRENPHIYKINLCVISETTLHMQLTEWYWRKILSSTTQDMVSFSLKC